MCETCRTASGIAQSGCPGTTTLDNGLRVAYVGRYWLALPDGLVRHEPTPLAHCLHRYKFMGDRYTGHCLARLFAESLASWLTLRSAMPCCHDAIVPIPLSPDGLRTRRFNQSAWLARRLARRVGTAYRPGWLARSATSQPQHGLGAVARRANMRGVFRVPHLPAPRARVLVVDDVCTTGATLAEAVRVLVEAGAAEIDAAVLLLAEGRMEGNSR